MFRALELDNERKLDLIHKHVPTLFRAVFCQFAATSGTPTWEKFRLGRWEYLSFVLRKPGIPCPADIPDSSGPGQGDLPRALTFAASG